VRLLVAPLQHQQANGAGIVIMLRRIDFTNVVNANMQTLLVKKIVTVFTVHGPHQLGPSIKLSKKCTMAYRCELKRLTELNQKSF